MNSGKTEQFILISFTILASSSQPTLEVEAGQGPQQFVEVEIEAVALRAEMLIENHHNSKDMV